MILVGGLQSPWLTTPLCCPARGELVGHPGTLMVFGDETLCWERSSLEITEEIKFGVFAKSEILCWQLLEIWGPKAIYVNLWNNSRM